MSWFTDAVQDYVNLQMQLNQVTEAYKRLQATNLQLQAKVKELTPSDQDEEKGDGKS